MYEVWLIRIKEQVRKERSTVCTHRYVECLLKNTSTKEKKNMLSTTLFNNPVSILYSATLSSKIVCSVYILVPNLVILCSVCILVHKKE
jgi:hypothetical protein